MGNGTGGITVIGGPQPGFTETGLTFEITDHTGHRENSRQFVFIDKGIDIGNRKGPAAGPGSIAAVTAVPHGPGTIVDQIGQIRRAAAALIVLMGGVTISR